MISTTGRIPVMAAPTPMPLMPASEIGESITRFLPNSCTNPESTLNGVPASATSSPMMKTVGSRRISSASASLMAWAKVISRLVFCSEPVACVGAFIFRYNVWVAVSSYESRVSSLEPETRNAKLETVLRVHILLHFSRIRVRRLRRELDPFFNFRGDFVFHFLQQFVIRHFAFL